MGLAEGQAGFSPLETGEGISGEQQSCFRDENQGFLLFSLYLSASLQEGGP